MPPPGSPGSAGTPQGDLLRQGLQWLEQQRTAHMTSPVIYRRVGQADLTVNATFGKTRFEVSDATFGPMGAGLSISSHVWDFLILAAELTGLEPKPGDVIIANTRQYEVMALGSGSGGSAPGGGFRGWQWSDPYCTTFRIHTKDIGAA